MSGTSIDGVDAVLADFSTQPLRARAHAYVGFDPALRRELTALQREGTNEIERACLAANALMDVYATAVVAALRMASVDGSQVAAIGMHGQTIRHRPDLGFTVQLANPARLVEATGIAVVADFRRRDVAAGGQGAPLAPAFHAATFANPGASRAVVNIGGIANVTALGADGSVRGFDTGPGNTLLDGWIERERGERFDRDGAWAAQGRVSETLLERLLGDEYFALRPPKSTGRDRFNLRWLQRRLRPNDAAVDVQRTLARFTARSIAIAIATHCAECDRIVVCGGGARNATVMADLATEASPRAVITSAELGIPVDQVEALAFAWLAREARHGRPGNLPAVTGARGPRVLGAIYPA
jgi:anhydro-N-acetylmuramic acid kinase